MFSAIVHLHKIHQSVFGESCTIRIEHGTITCNSAHKPFSEATVKHLVNSKFKEILDISSRDVNQFIHNADHMSDTFSPICDQIEQILTVELGDKINRFIAVSYGETSHTIITCTRIIKGCVHKLIMYYSPISDSYSEYTIDDKPKPKESLEMIFLSASACDEVHKLLQGPDEIDVDYPDSDLYVDWHYNSDED